MYVIYNQVNVLALLDNYHIVLNCTVHFVDSRLNSYFKYIEYWTLNLYDYFIITYCSVIIYAYIFWLLKMLSSCPLSLTYCGIFLN